MFRPPASDFGATRKRALGALTLACLCGAWGWLEVTDEDVERGNRAYAEERFDQALGAYRQARARAGRDTAAEAQVLYNTGAALYRMFERNDAAGVEPDGHGTHQGAGQDAGPGVDELDSPGAIQRYGAIESFRSAAALGMRHQQYELASSAYLGLGNALFSAGDFKGAITAYKDALRANPDNDDARYNLELSWRRLDRNSGGRPPPGQPRRHPPRGQGDGQSGQSPHGQGQSPGRQGGRNGESSGRPGSGNRNGDGERSGSDGQNGRQQSGNGQANGPTEDNASRADSSGDQASGQSPGQSPGQSNDANDRANDQAGDRSPGQSGDRGVTDRPGNPDEAPAGDGQAEKDSGNTSSRAGPGQERTGTPSPDVGNKLDALERMSRDLQHEKLRARTHRSRTGRPQRDW